MRAIKVPVSGRPEESPGSGNLVGVDGCSGNLVGGDRNVFNVIGRTMALLRRAGATPEFIDAYTVEAESGDYDHAIRASIAYLDAGRLPPRVEGGVIPVLPPADPSLMGPSSRFRPCNRCGGSPDTHNANRGAEFVGHEYS